MKKSYFLLMALFLASCSSSLTESGNEQNSTPASVEVPTPSLPAATPATEGTIPALTTATQSPEGSPISTPGNRSFLLRQTNLQLTLPEGFQKAEELKLIDFAENVKPVIVVHYPSASLFPASREETCLAIARAGSAEERKKCIDALVIAEAVSTLSETLRDLTCVRDEQGLCRERTEAIPAGCTKYVDEPCWVPDKNSREDRVEFHIGMTPLVNQITQMNPDYASLDEEGSLIYALNNSEGKQRIILASPSSYGLMFGVAGFLKNWGDVHWVFPGKAPESMNPSALRWNWDSNALWLYQLQWADAPDYKGRSLAGIGNHPSWGLQSIKTIRTWLLRNRLRPDFHQPYIDALQHKPEMIANESRYDFSQIMNSYIDPALYGNQREHPESYHPEWYPNFSWYPYAGNARIPIHRFSDSNGRRFPADIALRCDTSLPVDAGCFWPVDGITQAAGGLPDSGLKLFWGSSSLVPYSIVADAAGINHFIPGMLPAATIFPTTMNDQDKSHKGRVSLWNNLIPGDSGSWKPCLWEGSAEKPAPRESLVRHFVHKLKESLSKNPFLKMVSLAPSDGGGYCQCPRCRSKDGEKFYGNNQFEFDIRFDHKAASQFTRRFFEFFKSVGEAAPDVPIATLAYANYLALPRLEAGDVTPGEAENLPHKGNIQLPPNVNVVLAVPLDEQDYDTAASDNNSPLKKNVEEWAQVAPAQQIGLYDYMYGLSYISPHIYINRIANALKHAYAHGARIYTSEAYSNLGMDAMQVYVVMNLLWDTTQDPYQLREEFTKGLVKDEEASTALVDFYKAAEKSWKNHPNRWHKLPFSGLSRFERVEKDKKIIGPGGMPYGMGSARQFCSYLPQNFSSSLNAFSKAETKVCENPKNPSCAYFKYTVNSYRIFLDLVRLTHAKNTSELGNNFARQTVNGKITHLISENAKLLEEIPTFHPATLTYSSALINELDGILNNVTSSRFPSQSYCEWEASRAYNDRSRPAP